MAFGTPTRTPASWAGSPMPLAPLFAGLVDVRRRWPRARRRLRTRRPHRGAGRTLWRRTSLRHRPVAGRSSRLPASTAARRRGAAGRRRVSSPTTTTRWRRARPARRPLHEGPGGRSERRWGASPVPAAWSARASGTTRGGRGPLSRFWTPPPPRPGRRRVVVAPASGRGTSAAARSGRAGPTYSRPDRRDARTSRRSRTGGSRSRASGRPATTSRPWTTRPRAAHGRVPLPVPDPPFELTASPGPPVRADGLDVTWRSGRAWRPLRPDSAGRRPVARRRAPSRTRGGRAAAGTSPAATP